MLLFGVLYGELGVVTEPVISGLAYFWKLFYEKVDLLDPWSLECNFFLSDEKKGITFSDSCEARAKLSS